MLSMFRKPTAQQIAKRRRQELQMTLIQHVDSLKLAERNVAYTQQMLQELDTLLASGELEDWTPTPVPALTVAKTPKDPNPTPTFLSTRLPKEAPAM